MLLTAEGSCIRPFNKVRDPSQRNEDQKYIQPYMKNLAIQFMPLDTQDRMVRTRAKSQGLKTLSNTNCSLPFTRESIPKKVGSWGQLTITKPFMMD